MAISGNFEHFDFETDFQENEKAFFKKLESRFLVESTKKVKHMVIHMVNLKRNLLMF